MQCTDRSRSSVVITPAGLQCLIEALRRQAYRVVGPTRRDGAIVYDDIADTADLPQGWTDNQDAGRYALERRSDNAFFGFNVGPHSWKKYLFPPVETLWSARRGEDGSLTVSEPDPPAEKFAFIGVRSCELHAIAVQDKVFCEGPYANTAYSMRRQNAFIVAVNCGQAAKTCFCTSMQTGPRADAGFDLSLTELVDAPEHCFVVEIGSEQGARVMEGVPHQPASDTHGEAADAVSAKAASEMGRSLDTDGLKELLQGNLEHPRWNDVAGRCLSCGNCTMVCPTCFCSTVEDHSDLENRNAEHVRKWDSCFTLDFSYIHGGSVRTSTHSRYRQWMTHKLANWIDQFDTSGCVGCGRCITWCPTGIDLTEEAAAIRAAPQKGRGG